jgi:hypothetical protein
MCQPLHGSYHSDRYRDAADATSKKWPGKGIHSTYKDKMVDRHSTDLLPQIIPQAKEFNGAIPAISDGRDAAFATVTLMGQAADILPPSKLIDEYVRLGGGSSASVVDGLWEVFGGDTADGGQCPVPCGHVGGSICEGRHITVSWSSRNIGSGTC